MRITDVKLTAFRRPAPPDAKEAMIKGFSVRSLRTDIVAVQIIIDEGFIGENPSLGGGLGMRIISPRISSQCASAATPCCLLDTPSTLIAIRNTIRNTMNSAKAAPFT